MIKNKSWASLFHHLLVFFKKKIPNLVE